MKTPAYTPDPEGWYDAYGWHLTPEDPSLPDFPLQMIAYDDAADPRAAAEALRAEHPRLTGAEAERIAWRAAEVRTAADHICSLLERARDARSKADREALLAEAARAESEHGATPETDRARRAFRGEEV